VGDASRLRHAHPSHGTEVAELNREEWVNGRQKWAIREEKAMNQVSK